MTTPRSVFERNMESGEVRLLKQEEILGGFDASNYVSQRKWVTARDGIRVPVSIVYRKDTKLDGMSPCLLYGYGSYGASIPPSFSSSRLNLLDRGFVYAIAHIRGGQVLGRSWYEDGKLLKKKNTFTDFIDVGRFLVSEKYADPKRLYARGGSAGGLLIGAAINMQPDLFHGTITEIQCAENTIAVFFFDHTFGMAKLKRTGNLFTDGQNVFVRVDLHAKQAQNAANEQPHNADDG